MTPRKKVAKPKKKAVRKPTQPKESGMARDQSRVDQGRREIGARIHNHHVPSKDREGDGSASSTVPASIVLGLPTAPFLVGDSKQITATVYNAAGVALNGVLPDAWQSADPSIVAVNGTGIVTAVAVGGPVLITASISNINVSTPITVSAPVVDTTPASVAVAPGTVSLSSGTSQLTATLKNAAGDILTATPTGWTSIAESVATVDSSGLVTFVGVGTTNVVAHYNAIASNACVVTGLASGATGINLLKHDFEDGTLGPFFNPYLSVNTNIDVIADPTSRASGNVCRIRYENFPESGNFDCNLAIAPKPEFNPGRKLGEELWCQWKFYLDTDGTSPAIRKFNYWGWSNDSWGFQHAFNFVIASANSVAAPIPAGTPIQWLINAHVVATDGTLVSGFGPEVEQAGPGTWYGPANITLKTWHKIKVQQKLNSSFSAQDGILRIWFNDVLLFESTDMHWTDPSWTDDPATYQWVDYRIGEQLNGSDHMAESRYIDDVSFATTEAAL